MNWVKVWNMSSELVPYMTYIIPYCFVGQSLRSGSLCKPGSMLGYSGLGGSTLYTDELYNTPEGGSPHSLAGSCSSPKYFDLDSNRSHDLSRSHDLPRSHGVGVTGCIQTVPGMTAVTQDDTHVTSFTGIHPGRYST